MKIAIVGTSPHRVKAPYKDSAWQIWVCSPKNIGEIPRFDEWFELHDLDAPGRLTAQLKSFLETDHGKPIWMHERFCSRYPSAKPFPFDEMRKEFGDYFFTSSIAWMLALAISLKPESIGLYGVDMGADGEYKDQRWGCQHFIEAAKARGIQIVMPQESKLHARPRLYGLEDISPAEKDMRRRLKDLKAAEAQNRRNADMQLGAITVIEDILRADFPPN